MEIFLLSYNPFRFINLQSHPLEALKSLPSTTFFSIISQCVISAFFIMSLHETLDPRERLLSIHSSMKSSSFACKGFLPPPPSLLLCFALAVVPSRPLLLLLVARHSRILLSSTENHLEAGRLPLISA